MKDIITAGDPDQVRGHGFDAIQEDEFETSSATTNGDENAASSRFKNRPEETRIMCARVAILFVLLVSAITLAVVAFVTISNNQQDSFRAEVRSRFQLLTLPCLSCDQHQ